MKNLFDHQLLQARAWVDERLAHWDARLGWHEEMRRAATYVVSGGGKAARPALVYWSWSQLTANAGKPPETVLDLGLALEFVHSYSLVHDDLPAMDNDDFRRGRPTLHRLMNDALAILGGDALLTGAFEILALSPIDHAARSAALLEISRAAGGAGMVAGQVIDLTLKGAVPSVEELCHNHNLKTGALFGAALALGAVGASASLPKVEAARAWGVKLGLLFQVVDDILDADSKGDEGPNFVQRLGLNETSAFAERLRGELAHEARELGFGETGTAALLDFFVRRKV